MKNQYLFATMFISRSHRGDKLSRSVEVEESAARKSFRNPAATCTPGERAIRRPAHRERVSRWIKRALNFSIKEFLYHCLVFLFSCSLPFQAVDVVNAANLGHVTLSRCKFEREMFID